MKVSGTGMAYITYKTENSTSKHIFMVGTRNETETGEKYTEYERLEYWEEGGERVHVGDWITLPGKYFPGNVEVLASSPYREYRDIEFEVVEKEAPADPIKGWFYPLIVFWLSLLTAINWFWKKTKTMFGFE
jgi:hypothetical protein